MSKLGEAARALLADAEVLGGNASRTDMQVSTVAWLKLEGAALASPPAAYQARAEGGCAHAYRPLLGGCRCEKCGHQIAWDARLVPPAASREAILEAIEGAPLKGVCAQVTRPLNIGDLLSPAQIDAIASAVLAVVGEPQARAAKDEGVAFQDAAEAVCCYCAGHCPPFVREPDGPNSAGNFSHEQREGGTPALCKASGLWALWRFRIVRAASEREGKS